MIYATWHIQTKLWDVWFKSLTKETRLAVLDRESCRISSKHLYVR
jgi:hypothetical protein